MLGLLYVKNYASPENMQNVMKCTLVTENVIVTSLKESKQVKFNFRVKSEWVLYWNHAVSNLLCVINGIIKNNIYRF